MNRCTPHVQQSCLDFERIANPIRRLAEIMPCRSRQCTRYISAEHRANVPTAAEAPACGLAIAQSQILPVSGQQIECEKTWVPTAKHQILELRSATSVEG